MKAMNDIDVRAPDLFERADLVFAILKVTFLMSAKNMVEPVGDFPAKCFASLKRKKFQPPSVHPPLRSGRG
jgi:hypothetical protein